MKDYRYSINLFLKDEDDIEVAEAEFSKALELPKKFLPQPFNMESLCYKENEIEIANQHCTQLNQVIRKIGYTYVEFKIREIKVR